MGELITEWVTWYNVETFAYVYHAIQSEAIAFQLWSRDF